MAEIKKLPTNLDDFVHPASQDVVADLCVFATQESYRNRLSKLLLSQMNLFRMQP